MIKIYQDLTEECWKGGNKKKYIIVHHTASTKQTTFENLITYFKKNDDKSVHYVVGRQGEITQMVKEDDRAWHAGVSSWNGDRDLNNCSIGIEVLSDGYSFTASQIESTMLLIRDIMKRNGISSDNVLRHADIAPGRKWDIGPAFYEKAFGTWQGFQNALNDNVDHKNISKLEGRWSQVALDINKALENFNLVTEELANAKKVPFTPYKITR